jgi:hypothetical protein
MDLIVFINGYFVDAISGDINQIGEAIAIWERELQAGEKISFRVYRLGSTGWQRG